MVHSEPGAGTSFEIYLPRAAEPAVERVPAPRTQTPSPPRATILLAEDDPEVRGSIERLLREGGHEVLSAPDGESALVVARGHAGPIDILITDVVMSGLGGGDLARRLGGERPETRVLFISGYHPDGTLPLGEDPAQWSEYLQKPVSFEALQRKIAALLAGGEGAVAVGEGGAVAGGAAVRKRPSTPT